MIWLWLIMPQLMVLLSFVKNILWLIWPYIFVTPRALIFSICFFEQFMINLLYVKPENLDVSPTSATQDLGAESKATAYKKRHRGCSYCILDIENLPIPEFPSNEEVVGVITMEDVIEELLQVMFSY